MTYNQQLYGQLLSETLPATIESEADRQRVLPIINNLIRKGDALSPEETRLLRLLASLVAGYEAKTFPIEPLEPQVLLKTLLEEREFRQKDLLPIFGSEGITSDILAGRRAIGKKKAQELAEFFGVSYKIFL
jgi:HTH-type transcriptional regulator/antitoxin HigA